MPGYIHTCGKCGAHMQVHERYLGRTLKCTSCRTEFEAVMPEGAIEEEPSLPDLGDDEARSGVKRLIPWLLLALIPVVALVWFLGQDQSEGPAQTVFREQRSVGENATVDTGLGRPVLAALDHEAVAALQTIGQGNVQINVGALMDQDRYIELPSGTKVRILEYANKSREARIRILEGPWQSKVVWVPTRWIR
jgi:predicted  nucleic acid-binding Zn-ribbon protein